MGTGPETTAEDNAKGGKRKRATGSGSPRGRSQSLPEPQEQTGSSSVHKVIQTTPKRQRVEAVITDVSSAQPEPSGFGESYEASMLFLPVEILQYTISFLDPFSIGRLMCVNKHLHTLVDPRCVPAQASGKTKLALLSADKIWSSSRRSYLPGVPHPLRSVTELGMLRLIYGRRCQKCGRLPKSSTTKMKVTLWDSGPGPRGVRTIWPFKVKMCGDCLRPLLVKETDLTQPGNLQPPPGLVFASFTPSLHYVMSITLTQAPVPQRLQLTKFCYRTDVEEVLSSVSNMRALGNTAFESWCQQQDALRQETVTDIVRLEAWELSQNANIDLLAMPSNVTSRSSASGSSIQSDNLSRSYITASSGGYRAFAAGSTHSGVGSSKPSGSALYYDTVLHPHTFRRDLKGDALSNPTTSDYRSVPSKIDVSSHALQPEPNQNSFDTIRLKGEMRADIQRRCMDLAPPILPHVLDRLSVFQSALQALTPINDVTWETLKVQLLNQRHYLDISQPSMVEPSLNTDMMDTSTIWRASTPEDVPVEIDLRAQALRPVRDKLYQFAREYVHRRYADGTGLNYGSAPQFAADVLLYVRQRFYQNQEAEDAAYAAHGEQRPDEGPSGIRTRVLKLEHMRYVFDTSIKPLTEFLRKDIFLCSACVDHGRYFEFEAIIQHFASKHTDNFSRGKAMVYWKAEWPLNPPFEPAPGRDPDPTSSVSYPDSAPQLPPMVRTRTAAAPLESENVPIGRHDHYLGRPIQQLTHVVHEIPREDRQLQEFHQYEHGPHPFATSRTSMFQPQSHRFADDDSVRRREPRQYNDLHTTHTIQSHLPHLTATEIRSRHQIEPHRDAWPQLEPIRQHVDVVMTEAGQTPAMQYERAPQHPQLGYGYGTQHRPQFADSIPTEHERLHRASSNDQQSQPEHRFTTYTERVYPRHRQLISDGAAQSSPGRHSRASSTNRHSDAGASRAVALDRASDTQQNAAERFLESFDVETARELDKAMIRSASVIQTPRPLSREDFGSRESMLDRRPNISQLRRRTEVTRDTEREWPVPRGATGDVDARVSQRRHDDLTRDTYHAQDVHYRQPTQYRRDAEDYGYHTSPIRTRYYEDSRGDSRSIEHRYSQHSPVRYVYQYDREMEPQRTEMRYADSDVYRQVVIERPYQYSDAASSGYQPYDPQYERQITPPLHRIREYPVDRPPPEYRAGREYVEYIERPRREVVYEDDDHDRSLQPPPPPRPLEDPMYERR